MTASSNSNDNHSKQALLNALSSLFTIGRKNEIKLSALTKNMAASQKRNQLMEALGVKQQALRDKW